MRHVQTFAQHPVRASPRLSSVPQAAQRAVSVILASFSMDRSVLKRLSVAAMTTENLIRYNSNFCVCSEKKPYYNMSGTYDVFVRIRANRANK